MNDLPIFDELYVVSDLHMGGRPGFQILRHSDRLGRFIEHIAAHRPDADIALVLNGDIIDSLAEDIQGYIAIRDAARMMDRIYEHFAPVWDGLASFVRTARRHLVVVTGNHDIEMALPGVERSMRRRIAGNDPASNGVITFATHGTGWACNVGNARVFCTHGNEVDSWNLVDYEALAQLGLAENAAGTYRWTPNAGTQLVVDLMNSVKARYPFVDLLKPETKIVVPILLVLDPGLAAKIDPASVLGVGWKKLKGSLRTAGLLSADQEGPDAVTDADTVATLALDELLGEQMKQLIGQPRSDPDDLLLEAEGVLRGTQPAAVSNGDGDETLGWFGMALDRLGGVDKVEALRHALLDWLAGDDSFDLDKRDATFDAVSGKVSAEVNFVITGHTHMERAISVDPGSNRFYYNCGTWIRLIRFSEDLLSNASEFAKVFAVLENGSLAALDEAQTPQGPLVLDRTTAVRISADPHGTVGHLLHVSDDGRSVHLAPVAGSEFRKPE